MKIFTFEIRLGLAALAAVAVVSGCGGSGSKNTTPTSTTYTQIDRLARPAVNEVFATVANNRHQINDEDSPPNDKNQLMNDIDGFLQMPAGRSAATRKVIESILVPDMLKADLSQSGIGSYLGTETGGATGGKFGGRMLTDDVIDISLGIIFGNTVSALGLAPDDGAEIPTLTNDHVTDAGKHFISTFPYLGAPR